MGTYDFILLQIWREYKQKIKKMPIRKIEVSNLSI